MGVLNLNADEFEDEVLNSNVPVLVDFWAPWCMPCRMMASILEELSKKMNGKIKVAKVNTEEAENQMLANEYQIRSIPNMKLFKDGQVIGEFIGLRDLKTIQREIEGLI